MLGAWFAYALFGMSLFKGLTWHCTDDTFPANTPASGIRDSDTGVWSVPPCGVEYAQNFTSDVIISPRGSWKNTVFNFDNIVNSILSVFLISVGGWTGLLHNIMDGTSPGYSPQTNYNWSASLYFTAGCCFFNLYLLSLFIGIVYDCASRPSS